MKLKSFLIYGLVAVVLIVGQFFINQGLVRGKPPEMLATTISNTSVTQLLENKPRLIYFWATWCGVCRNIEGTMTELFKEYGGISVAVKSGNAPILMNYLQKQTLNWQVIADEDGGIGERFGVGAVPVVFILDKQGHIKYHTIGYVTSWGLQARLWLAGL